MPKSLILGGLCLLASCAANVTHQPETAQSTGIRYYESAPYLIVYSDGKGGLRWQIRYLPDQSRVMSATPTVIGGRTEMTLFFQNGVMSSVSVVADTTELPKAVIAAITSAIPLLAGAGPVQEGFPAPYLYKIVVEGSSVRFIGGQGKTHIQVPVSTGVTR